MLFYFSDCLRFSFMHLVQRDLSKVQAEWNSHRLRPVRNSECPSGHPNELYFMPEILGEYNIKGKLLKSASSPLYMAAPWIPSWLIDLSKGHTAMVLLCKYFIAMHWPSWWLNMGEHRHCAGTPHWWGGIGEYALPCGVWKPIVLSKNQSLTGLVSSPPPHLC
jgi:hypothetical protein